MNFVDDTILPQLGANGGDVDEIAPRWIQYARGAEEAGADVILNACSSVGEVCRPAQDQVSIPIVRIDEAMAESAVARARTLGVAATVPTTLHPTVRLLREKAAAVDRQVDTRSLLVGGAFERLAAGDQEGHDALLVEALMGLAAQVELVVLAQASMARVVPRLPEAMRARFVSSPRLGMERVRQVLNGHAAGEPTERDEAGEACAAHVA
jgi:aspartate/glutamate racemase